MSKFRNENEITKEEFINVCKNSKTKQEAYITLNMHRNTFEKYLIKYEYEFPKVKHSPKKIDIQDIFDGKHPHYNASHLHQRLIKEGFKEAKCECCGLREWMNHPIMLELHHIDGNHCNNKLENLQLLCPNCHALTDNFKSKNIKHYNNL